MAEILLYACIPLALAAFFVALAWAWQYFRWSAASGRPRVALYRGPLLVTLACLCLGLAAAVYYAETVQQTGYAEANTRFLHEAEQLEADLQGQISDMGQQLNGVRGLFLASNDVSRSEFQRYYESRERHQDFPGFRGLGFVERVPRARLPALEGLMRREFGRGFQVRTGGSQEDLFVVKYLEPLVRNREALGFDIGSEALRRTAAESAMRSGEAALTARIVLIQDALRRPGFLYLLPVYAASVSPPTEEERVRTLRGWVYAPLVFSELMAGGNGVHSPALDYQVFDAPDPMASALVYDSQLPTGQVNVPDSMARNAHSAFSALRPIMLADQVFYLRISSSPAFEATYHQHEHLKAAMLGSGLSVLAALVLWLLMAGRARAVDLAQSMTHDLERLAMVARRTSNAVYFADTGWHITWVNEGFTRMCGFLPEETLGKRPSQLLHSPLADPGIPQAIDSQAEIGNRVNIQVLQRNKGGQDYWVDLEVMPIFGSDGRITGYLSVQSDITEVVMAKAALLLEKERAENILSGTNVGTWESNLLTGEQRWNDRWSAMMGFAREDVLPNMAVFLQQRLHPADQPRMHRALLDCLAGRTEVMSCEVRVLHKDGSWMWILSRAKVMSRGQSGRTQWVGGIHTDITELKLATAAAESISAKRGEEQRRLQNILEGTHVGTWEWNLLTGESIYNEQYVGMLGYTLQELEPMGYDTWVRLVHPDDLVASAALMQEHLQGGTADYEIEVRMQHKQGHWIWVLAKGKLAQRLEDGRPLWVYGTHMDITERKRAAQQLAQTTAMLQNVLDSATAVGVMTMGLDQGIRVFNRGAENLLGYQARDVVEQQSASDFFDLTELGALRETLELVLGHEPNLQEVFAQVVQTRDEQEWTLLRKDGSRFKASLIFSPMRDAQGVLEGHLAIMYDISKQKEYESSMREAMRLAEQSSVAKSQFLANMSHEIRTPMNAILGMLQLLRDTALNPNQSDYTDKAVGAARSLLGLLNDILDFSKVEAGKMQLNPEPFVVDSLLGDLSVILSSNLGSKAVDLVFEVDPAIPRELIGDAMRLKQILINLGGNAVKFTERGEVVIGLSLLARTPERVKLAVSVVDTGIGIAPENQSRIFDAFTQAEANTTRRFGGTGLGLVISTRLIRLMGGELQLSSVLGQGSSFSFTVELQTADFCQDVPPPVPASLAQPLARVLLVDDNPRALASSAAMMRAQGWEVSEAACGALALDWLQADLAAQAQPLDALFVDAEMPGMDGWETLRKVRRLYGGRTPPLLVLMSRQSRGSLAQRTEREQELLNGLVVKPLTGPMFAKALVQAQAGSQTLVAKPQAVPKRLAGMRLLLVEDNPINQQVAQELLQAQGASVSLANNGELGLTAIAQAQPAFHAVLMDLQMPVMDGLTATRLLRADARFADLPVIAMTANAMHSDREECLAAGMNDHVGKPFDLAQLVQTLILHTRWVARAEATVVDYGPTAAHSSLPQAAAGAWPEGLDIELALARMGGDRSLLQRAILAYAADARLLPQRLEQGLQQGELAQVKRDLHGVKGLSATIGATALALLAARAEKLLHTPDSVADCLQAVAQFTEQLAAQLPVLEAVARSLQDGNGLPAQAPERPGAALAQGDLELLQNLLAALQRSDMVAMELHARLGPLLGSAWGGAMEPLDHAMADLEFEAAAGECEKLLRQFDTTQGRAYS